MKGWLVDQWCKDCGTQLRQSNLSKNYWCSECWEFKEIKKRFNPNASFR